MYLAIIIAILMLFNLFFYIFDKRMLPTIIDMAEIKMESEAVSIINEESVAVYSENFKYDDIIHRRHSSKRQNIGKIHSPVFSHTLPRHFGIKAAFHTRSPPVAMSVSVSDIL